MTTKSVIVMGLFCMLTACANPCRVPASTYQKPSVAHIYKQGDHVFPLKAFDFDHGNWTVYVALSSDDYGDLAPGITRTRCLKTKDRELMKHMAATWEFTYTAGDMATLESSIYFVKDDKVVFESGILISRNNEGMQSEEYGWLEPVNKTTISAAISKFERAC
jgi:hypothetical protein